jgi:hypothetical protein
MADSGGPSIRNDNSNQFGAGGGGGGMFLILYNTLISNTATYTVNGGLGGSQGFNVGGVGGAGYYYVGKNTEF